MTGDDLRRFFAKVEIDPETGCWIWTGAKLLKGTVDPEGYGRFRFEGENRLAYKVAYEVFVGPVPSGAVLDHLCEKRPCVNPAHLEPISNGENIRRAGPYQLALVECRNGHTYTPENTLVTPQGWRRCRTCARNARDRWRERRAA